jgi:thiamine phosphate synthase YjbQ (UPF0047 family)
MWDEDRKGGHGDEALCTSASRIMQNSTTDLLSTANRIKMFGNVVVQTRKLLRVSHEQLLTSAVHPCTHSSALAFGDGVCVHQAKLVLGVWQGIKMKCLKQARTPPCTSLGGFRVGMGEIIGGLRG